jgi:hypothetical protein
MVDLNGVFAKTTDGTNKYVQTPVVAEKTVSTLVASLNPIVAKECSPDSLK